MGKTVKEWLFRCLTALVAVPVALKLLFSDQGSFLLLQVLQLGCIIEYQVNICPRILQSIDKSHQHKSFAQVGFFCILTFAAGVAATQGKKEYDFASFALQFIIVVFHFARHDQGKHLLTYKSLMDLFLDLFALHYISNGFSYAILLRRFTQYSSSLQILAASCMWNTDNGGLFFGSMFKSRKFLPVVSPGKTVSGIIGGICGSILTSIFIFWLSNSSELLDLPSIKIASQILLGFALGIAAIIGDLIESFLKRVGGIKDSGVFFPGHGGCFDRMDSMLLVTPLLYFFVSNILPTTV